MARSDLSRADESESETEGSRRDIAELLSDEGSDETTEEERHPQPSSQSSSRRSHFWSWLNVPFFRRTSSRRRSAGRHTHHHHHHSRRSRSGRGTSCKHRNYASAICSLIVILILSTAMVTPKWFFVKGGGCRDYTNSAVHTLSLYRFFYLGHFTQYDGTGSLHTTRTVYSYSSHVNDVLIDCVSPKAVHILRSVISLCFIGIAFNCMAFFLDMVAPSNKLLVILRRNAIFNIVTVMVCITINGFCFMVTQLVETLQKETKPHQFSKVEVQFDISFYLVAGAGGMSIVAIAFNLLRRQQPQETSYYSSEQRGRLLDDYDDMQQPVLDLQPDYYAPMPFNAPPPAYTP